MQVTDAALEARARRAAKKIGIRAMKSRWRTGSCDNYGGFMLVDDRNFCRAGARWDMTAEEVIEYCADE